MKHITLSALAFCSLLIATSCGKTKPKATADATVSAPASVVPTSPAKSAESSPAEISQTTTKASGAVPQVSAVKAKEPAPETIAVTQENVADQPLESLSPTQIIERYTQQLKGVVEIKDPGKKGVKDESRENYIADKVRELFDFNELALQSLGRENTKKFSAAKRKDYAQLFTTLVERNYLERSRSIMGEYDVKILGEKILKDKATVQTRIMRSDVARSDIDVNISYELHRKNNRWMIFNIIFDEVNLIRNYQSQFNKVIANGGPDRLMTLLRDKVKQAGKEDIKI